MEKPLGISLHIFHYRIIPSTRPIVGGSLPLLVLGSVEKQATNKVDREITGTSDLFCEQGSPILVQ
ncbi:hypothetical protein N7504_002206 [Penicillium tannophilum]|nr:hypothetical protein N7504_002206 [Penicillium tannophilum]